MRWIARAVAVVVGLWLVLVLSVTAAMLQTPDRFGLFMRSMPMALVWGATPARTIWLWAREGTVSPGDMAPDFTLWTSDRREQVTLSTHRGRQPVVLVFGSYT